MHLQKKTLYSAIQQKSAKLNQSARQTISYIASPVAPSSAAPLNETSVKSIAVRAHTFGSRRGAADYDSPFSL